jgi:predicted nucleic acid-binding protein
VNATPARPLFVDTAALYARVDDDDAHHERATAIFEGVLSGDLAYRPLYTSQSVLSELATLVLYNVGHAEAVRVLNTICDSSTFTVLAVDRPTFAAATDRFERFDDQRISFVDHTSAVLAEEHDVEHVFTFDSDFATMGFTRVPEDVPVGG